MANKPYKRLDVSDMALRMSSPVGMEDGVKQLIQRHCGFELYNTRPYHNYEDWSDGYIVMGRKDGKVTTTDWLIEQSRLPVKERDEQFLSVSREDLDEAVLEFAKQIGDVKRIEKWCNVLLDENTPNSRVMRLRKKMKDDK